MAARRWLEFRRSSYGLDEIDSASPQKKYRALQADAMSKLFGRHVEVCATLRWHNIVLSFIMTLAYPPMPYLLCEIAAKSCSRARS